ncbi:response regulator [Candidatus Chlorohelix sp.]|uniref:response regulator n=1 Tax=Candidatus Chlorohelix sp. TaxID=3139201 RepID=UPI00306AFD02
MLALVVNDTPEFRKVVRLILEINGHSVIEANSYSESYMQAAALKPKIVLVDNIINSEPCINLCKDIQAIPGMEETEFLIFTDLENESVDGTDINLKGIIKKPHIIQDLKTHLPQLDI